MTLLFSRMEKSLKLQNGTCLFLLGLHFWVCGQFNWIVWKFKKKCERKTWIIEWIWKKLVCLAHYPKKLKELGPLYVNQMFYEFLAFWLWCLMPFSTIFQLYHGGQFYWWRKPLTISITYIKLYRVHFTMSGIQIQNFSGDRNWLHR